MTNTHTTECLEMTADLIEDNASMEYTAEQLRTEGSRAACGYDAEVARRIRVSLEDREFCREYGCPE